MSTISGFHPPCVWLPGFLTSVSLFQTVPYDYGSFAHRLLYRRWMGTSIAYRLIEPGQLRPVEVVSGAVGRQNPDSSRHEGGRSSDAAVGFRCEDDLDERTL